MGGHQLSVPHILGIWLETQGSDLKCWAVTIAIEAQESWFIANALALWETKSLWQSPAFAPSPKLWILQLVFLLPCFPACKMGERSPLHFAGKQWRYIFVTRLSNSIKSSIAKQLRTWLILPLQLGLSHVQQGQPRSTQRMPRLPSIMEQLCRVRPLPRPGRGRDTHPAVKIGVGSSHHRVRTQAQGARGGKIAPFTISLAFRHFRVLGFARTLSLFLSVLWVANIPVSPPAKKCFPNGPFRQSALR